MVGGDLEALMQRLEALLSQLGEYLQNFSGRSYPALLRGENLTPAGVALVGAMAAQRAIREGRLEAAEGFLTGAEDDLERARRSHEPG